MAEEAGIEFKPGDVVQLKSGGPTMTVEQVGKHNVTEEDTVWCVWSEMVGKRQEVRREHFKPVTLTRNKPAGFSLRVERG